MSSELEEIFQKGLIAGISKYGHLLSEEPEDLRVFSSDIPGFFNRKLMLPGFDFSDQIVNNTGINYSNIVSTYPNNNKIICAGNKKATWHTNPGLVINSDNVMTKLGDPTSSYSSYNNASFWIPIKHVEGIVKFEITVMTEYKSDLIQLYLYRINNGSIDMTDGHVAYVQISRGMSDFPAYLNYYTYSKEYPNNVFFKNPIDIDYILLEAKYSSGKNCYFKELKLYKE